MVRTWARTGPADGSARGPAAALGAHAARVAALFDRNAARYDAVNSVLTCGLDGRWRRWAAGRALALAGPAPAAGVRPTVLDACGGTGLVALELARRGARVTVADVSDGMLAVARVRAARARLPVTCVRADLAAAPGAAALPGAPFAAATLAFGLRYAAEPGALLAGVAGLLAPGAPLVVLESVVPSGGLASRLAGVYFFRAVPRLGALLNGRRELYDELAATTLALGTRAALLRLLATAEFAVVEDRAFAAGVVAGAVGIAARGRVDAPGDL